MGGIVTAALLLAGYTALARSAVRTLDRDFSVLGALDTARRTAASALTLRAVQTDDDELVAVGRRALAAEHAKRIDVLLRRCRRLLAVDPGVRELRSAVCTAMRLDRQALVDLPDSPVTGQRHDAASRLLQRERRHWRVAAVPWDNPPPFTAARDVEARLRHYASEPVGARLLVVRGTELDVVDVDASTSTALHPGRTGRAAVVGDWIAVGAEDGVWGYDRDDLTKRKLIAETNYFVPSPETGSVWVEVNANFWEHDRLGRQLSEPFTPGEHILIAATARYLITTPYVSDGDGEVLAFTVWDRRTRTQVQHYEDARLLDARGDIVVWVDGAGVPHTNAPGYMFDTSNGPVRDAAIHPGGAGIATVANRQIRSFLSMSQPDGQWLTTAARINANEVFWSSDGRLLFFANFSAIGYAELPTLRNSVLRLPDQSYYLLGVL